MQDHMTNAWGSLGVASFSRTLRPFPSVTETIRFSSVFAGWWECHGVHVICLIVVWLLNRGLFLCVCECQLLYFVIICLVLIVPLVAAGRVVAHMGDTLCEAHLTLHGSVNVNSSTFCLQLPFMHVRLHSFAPVFPPRPDSESSSCCSCRPD